MPSCLPFRKRILGCCAIFVGLSVAVDTHAFPREQTRSDYAPIAVIQTTPGLQVSLSGGKLGVGVAIDVMAGVVLNGERCFCITPGVVGGGFAELQAVWGQGISYTTGWRAGGGAVAPTLSGGFMSVGLVAFERGRAWGAVNTVAQAHRQRHGVLVRSVFGSVTLDGLKADQPGRLKLAVEYPVLPMPWVE